jgi:hypothetical protein
VPLAVIGGRLLPSEGLDIPRQAFGWTIGITAKIVCLPDVVFARKLVPRTGGGAEARFLIGGGFTDHRQLITDHFGAEPPKSLRPDQRPAVRFSKAVLWPSYLRRYRYGCGRLNSSANTYRAQA